MDKPVWFSATAITAITSAVTALITIPGAISDYLIAKQEVTKKSLENVRIDQETRLGLVETVIGQEAENRGLILRYLKSTSEVNSGIQAWASAELQRVQTLENSLKSLEEKSAQLERINGELATALQVQEGQEESEKVKLNQRIVDLQAELTSAQGEVSRVKAEVSEARIEAGNAISNTSEIRNMRNGWKIDVFYCLGETTSEAEATDIFSFIRANINIKSDPILSQISIVELETLNPQQAVNLAMVGGQQIRYNPFDQDELNYATLLAKSMEDNGFGSFELLRVSTPTPNYISLFVCE